MKCRIFGGLYARIYFYLPYFKSAGKTVAVTNENGENVGQLKRMHKNMWTESIDF
ncbi:tubby C-terminal domain-like protein [Priestia megaterium]|uniref:tubby C-terminal domain-like protein n=1 Tax=Priestia megaterium TaxID=1404 RepID=UPI003FEDC5EA